MGSVLESILLVMAWTPVLVLLHELGHGLAALALTDGDVSLKLSRFGLVGGAAAYEPERLRRPRAEAWIAAAGPAVTLAAALALGAAWLGADAGFGAAVLRAGALAAALQLLVSILPVRYGAGLGGGESDGRVIWRVLTGAPPGGIEREERLLGEPERAVRPAFAALLAVAGALALLVDPWLCAGLAAMFGAAVLLQRKDVG
jgi:hypothetical protein